MSIELVGGLPDHIADAWNEDWAHIRQLRRQKGDLREALMAAQDALRRGQKPRGIMAQIDKALRDSKPGLKPLPSDVRPAYMRESPDLDRG